MATSKTKAKKSTAKKSPAKKAAVKSVSAQQEYSQTTWLLISIWLALILAFLAFVVYKLYINN